MILRETDCEAKVNEKLEALLRSWETRAQTLWAESSRHEHYGRQTAHGAECERAARELEQRVKEVRSAVR